MLGVLLIGCRRQGPIDMSALGWSVFSSSGATELCGQLVKRSAPLRLRGRGAIVGRFFYERCAVTLQPTTRTMVMRFAGTGYWHRPHGGRTSFSASATIEYRPHPLLSQNGLYVRGEIGRIVSGPTFKLDHALGLADAPGALPATQIGNLLGSSVVVGDLTRGFTLVYDSETRSSTFLFGILQPARTLHQEEGERHVGLSLLANETVVLKPGQRDYLGPFEIENQGQQLSMLYYQEGPALVATVVAESTGNAWRRQYQENLALGPAPGPVLATVALVPRTTVRSVVALPVGRYYVVVGPAQPSTSAIQPTAPAPVMSPVMATKTTARMSYVAERSFR